MAILLFFRILSALLATYIIYVSGRNLHRCSDACRKKQKRCKIMCLVLFSMIIYGIVSISDFSKYGLSHSLTYWYYWDILILTSVLLLIHKK